MIRLVVTCILLLMPAQAAFADALTPQDIKRCRAMAATLAPKSAEIKELTTRRDDLAILVEDKGDVWENAESLRLLSAEHARTADETKADYQASRQEFMRTEHALQAKLQQFNQDVSAYNASCAPSD